MSSRLSLGSEHRISSIESTLGWSGLVLGALGLVLVLNQGQAWSQIANPAGAPAPTGLVSAWPTSSCFVSGALPEGLG